MSIEDYAIDDSAFAELINAVKISSDSLESFNGAVTNEIYELTNNGVNVFGNDGNILFHTDNAGSIWVIPTTRVIHELYNSYKNNRPATFDEEPEPASDAELKELLGIK